MHTKQGERRWKLGHQKKAVKKGPEKKAFNNGSEKAFTKGLYKGLVKAFKRSFEKNRNKTTKNTYKQLGNKHTTITQVIIESLVLTRMVPVVIPRSVCLSLAVFLSLALVSIESSHFTFSFLNGGLGAGSPATKRYRF